MNADSIDGDERVPLSRIPIALFVRGLLVVLLMVGLVAGAHFYLGVRLVRDAGLPAPFSVLVWILLALLFVSIPAGFAASRAPRNGWSIGIQWVSHLWIGTFGLLLTAVVLSDASKWLGIPISDGARAAAVVSMGLVGVVVGMRTARGPARIERVNVTIPHLGDAFEGFRIVQISDIHIGPTLGKEFLRRVVDQVNALEPDLVAVTGDLVDGFVSTLRDEVAPLANLRAKSGVYYVTGNHEYYYGGGSWEAHVRKLGLQVLHNEHRVLQRGQDALVVAGVTDHEGGQFDPAHASDPARAFLGAPEHAARLLLAHQPRSARHAAGLGVDLQLSGHTHGGQMFPFMFLVRLQQPVIAGLKHIAGVPVYTSRGTGYWGPPIRLGAAPEISEITLTRKTG